MNIQTAFTELTGYVFDFFVWLWNFADSIIIYNGVTLLDAIVFTFIAIVCIDLVFWVNSKSIGDEN